MLHTISRFFVTAFCVSFLLSGCVTFGDPVNYPSKPNTPSLNEGRNSSNLRSALKVYQAELNAETNPIKRQALLLKNVDTLIQLGRISQAKPLFQQINQGQLSSNDQVLYLINKADILNYEGHPKEAVPFLPVDKPHFSPALRKRLLITQVRVLQAAGYPRFATVARIKLQRYLNTSYQTSSNADQIFADLSALQAPELNALKTKESDKDVQSWADFMLDVAPQRFSREALDSATMTWLAKHPDNTVPQRLIRQLQSQVQQLDKFPTHVGLLLPLGGAYDKVAQDIKQGFTSASLAYAGVDKPRVSVVTLSGDVQQQALEMQAQGFDMIVGPLQKDNVATLNSTAGLSIPVLALNRMTGYYNTQTRPRFYQFGLIPEDESIQAAQYAINSGLRTASVIAPSNAMGTRLVDAFTQEFEGLGGSVVHISRFTPKARDFGPAVRDALGIKNSDVANARYVKQKNKRRSTDFKPYISPNLDMIMMIASPKQARGIVPQLRFYDAEYLQILSNSMVFDGRDNPSLNKDLNRVQFTQPNWSLSTTQRMSKYEGTGNLHSNRFYALGYDAFSVIPMLSRMNQGGAFNYDGMTGRLTLGRGGVIHRELPWAIFKEGQVEFMQSQDLDSQIPAVELR